jgi:ketosteroid isomerase-like protein
LAEQSEAVALTNALMDDFFNSGKVSAILPYLDDDVVICRLDSAQYVRGREEAAKYLEACYAQLGPCRLGKEDFVEAGIAAGCSVQVKFSFWQGSCPRLADGSILFMYRRRGNSLCIEGIHVLCKKMDEMPPMTLEMGLEKQADNLAQLLNVVRSDLRCAYVLYKWQGSHALRLFWHLCG